MSTAAKVGGFFLVVLILAGLLIWRIEDLRIGRGPAKKVSVEFKDVAGLDAKSTVRLAGVRVGKVAKIRLTPDGKAIVDMDLDKDVELRQGASASIANLGLLGEKYVELVPGPVGAPELPEGTLLKGDLPVSFDQITRLARDIEVDVKDITRNLSQSLGGPQGEERLRTIIDNVRIITEDLRVMIASNRGNVDASLANLKEFSEGMTQLVARIDKLVASNTGNVSQGIANIKDVSGKLETTADNLNQITGKIKSGEGTVGKLVESEETHKNLNDALVAVKEGVQSLDKALGAVGRTRFDLGVRSSYLTRFSKAKGSFSLDVFPPESPRFYRVELTTQPFGRRTDSTTIEKTTFPDGHIEVKTTEETELKDELAITALLGYKYNDWAIRAGLIEGRGGAGLDYKLLKDRLQFSGDIWDFNRPSFSPHAAFTGKYFFSPSVYVQGGWDDVLNHSRQADSVFFGAGLRWNDDDIKYLLGSLPVRK
ncbi:MAG TPA: MlaD family protein [Thermoanaerobaculia bacterium]|jgi:phospholipid/cholesterol/gamma-HCH transport system substrate-binding protein|nr:MlaD family protein [Thermoanaerobaculia bacterium]